MVELLCGYFVLFLLFGSHKRLFGKSMEDFEIRGFLFSFPFFLKLRKRVRENKKY